MKRFTDPGLELKPDFVKCMERIYAWYDHQVIDRVPVRFSAHNAEYDVVDSADRWPDLKSRWYDVEYQVDKAVKTLEAGVYQGETFPLFWPNVGPNILAGTLGCELKFGEVTSWAMPCMEDASGYINLHYNKDSEYYKKIVELTDCALERCEHRFMVGYTDMHPGLDGASALLGVENLFMEMVEEPETVRALCERLGDICLEMMDDFHAKLSAHNQLSCTWIQIPSYETIHIPSDDHATMVSREMFNDIRLPSLKREMRHFDQNVFHVDGKGVANHLDALLDCDEIQGYQWVQGVGNDRPIMQWLPLIKRIQDRGKGVIVDLQVSELEPFIDAMRPEGIYLCIDESDPETQREILKRLLKWK